jgi:hypothetical protein
MMIAPTDSQNVRKHGLFFFHVETFSVVNWGFFFLLTTEIEGFRWLMSAF